MKIKIAEPYTPECKFLFVTGPCHNGCRFLRVACGDLGHYVYDTNQGRVFVYEEHSRQSKRLGAQKTVAEAITLAEELLAAKIPQHVQSYYKPVPPEPEPTPAQCPWCCGAVGFIYRPDESLPDWCQCMLCFATGPKAHTRQEAIEKWNQVPTRLSRMYMAPTG